jgi:hypothetical protein
MPVVERQRVGTLAGLNVFPLNDWPAKDRCFVNRVLLCLVAFLVVGSALAQSPEPNKLRITTWNLEWFPNGSAREATQEKQAQRIKAAADVLKELNPDSLMLQEVCDYAACNLLGDAIEPGVVKSKNESALSSTQEELFSVERRFASSRSCFTSSSGK